MIEPLLYLLGRYFALVTILYIAAWAVCFSRRRTRWVLPVWVSVAFPLALITLRWLRLFAFRTPFGPDGGFVAMEASFTFLGLLPFVIALAVFFFAVPHKPGWSIPAIIAGLAVGCAELAAFAHFTVRPPTGKAVHFEIKGLDGRPVPGVVFDQGGHANMTGSFPPQQFQADINGTIETHTDARGELSGIFKAKDMDSQSFRIQAIGSNDVPGRTDFNVEHSWSFDVGHEYESWNEHYSTELPNPPNFSRTIYLRPAGSFATLPYWKELSEALLRFKHEHHKVRLWRGSADSVLDDELLEPCRMLIMQGGEEEWRIGLDAIREASGHLRHFSEECELLAKRARSPKVQVARKERALSAARAILAWAQIPVADAADPISLLSEVATRNGERIKAWDDLRLETRKMVLDALADGRLKGLDTYMPTLSSIEPHIQDIQPLLESVDLRKVVIGCKALRQVWDPPPVKLAELDKVKTRSLPPEVVAEVKETERLLRMPQ